VNPAEFLEVLARQQGKYRDMRALVEEQRRVLEGTDLDALLGLVDRKRALLAEIEALESELLPLKSRWAELRAEFAPGELRRVEEAVEETKRLLGEIVRLEDEGRAAMERQRAEAAGDLKDLMMKRRARGAYGGGPAGPDPRFVDGSR
jgi:hypothetical protein